MKMTAASLGLALALFSIVDALGQTSTQPVVTIEATDAVASETGPDPGVFTISRTGSTDLELRVFYRIGGTASNGVDYETIQPTVVIPAKASSATVTITPIDDSIIEWTEGVALSLMSSPVMSPIPTYEIGLPNSARIMIRDNDGTNLPPEVRLTSPMNGASFRAPADILLAAAAGDKDGTVVTVEFFAGTTSLGIRTNYPPESMRLDNPFTLLWSGVPAGEYVLTALATDDQGASSRSAAVNVIVRPELLQPVVNVVVTDAVGLEIPEVPPGMGMPQRVDPAVFSITRRGPTNIDLTVNYSLGGTAVNGVDYVELPGQVVIPAGATAADVVVLPIDDLLVEQTEVVALTLEPIACIAIYPPPPECYLVGSANRGIAYIRDNDISTNPSLPVVTVVATDGVGTEIEEVLPGSDMPQLMDPAVFKIARTGATDQELRVYFSLSGSAENGVDYTEVPGSILIPAGAVSATVEIMPIDDSLAERTENVFLQLTYPPIMVAVYPPPPPPYALGRPSEAVAYIRDNDTPTNPAPVISVLASDSEAAEEASDPGTFTISRTGSTDKALVVYYSLGGTAQNGVDYGRLSNWVEIAAGSASADVVVKPVDDTLVERKEAVLLQLRPPIMPMPDGTIDPREPMPVVWPPPYMIGTPSAAIVSITDNDTYGSNVPPTVRITRPMDGSIFRAPANITIVADARDLDGFVESVEFFANDRSLGVASNNPAAAWPVNPFFITWSNVVSGKYILTAKATDNGGATAISSPVRVAVIETNPPPPITNSVPVVSIAAVDSMATEGQFTFATTLVSQSNLVWGTADSAGVCSGSIDTTLMAGMDPSIYPTRWTNVFCGTNTALFRVNRRGPTNEPLNVYYTVRGTASNGVDYVALPGVVTIPAGMRSSRIVLVPIDDGLVEGIETVVLTLVPPPDTTSVTPAPYLIGCPNRAAAILLDNETPPPYVRLTDGVFHGWLRGIDAPLYRLETSTDLRTWTSCIYPVPVDGTIHFVDPDAAEEPIRFYRVIPEYSPEPLE